VSQTVFWCNKAATGAEPSPVAQVVLLRLIMSCSWNQSIRNFSINLLFLVLLFMTCSYCMSLLYSVRSYFCRTNSYCAALRRWHTCEKNGESKMAWIKFSMQLREPPMYAGNFTVCVMTQTARNIRSISDITENLVSWHDPRPTHTILVNIFCLFSTTLLITVNRTMLVPGVLNT